MSQQKERERGHTHTQTHTQTHTHTHKHTHTHTQTHTHTHEHGTSKRTRAHNTWARGPSRAHAEHTHTTHTHTHTHEYRGKNALPLFRQRLLKKLHSEKPTFTLASQHLHSRVNVQQQTEAKEYTDCARIERHEHYAIEHHALLQLQVFCFRERPNSMNHQLSADTPRKVRLRRPLGVGWANGATAPQIFTQKAIERRSDFYPATP